MGCEKTVGDLGYQRVSQKIKSLARGDQDREGNTNHLCMVIWGRAGEGREAFTGKKKQIYHVEEVDRTSASPEDKHNLIITVDLAPDLFPAQRL